MAHPIIPQVLDLASPVAESLGLEVVGAVFHTNQNPPILRVDVRRLEQSTGLDDCERMSRALEPALDASGLLADTYVLEVSSPGISRVLETDREFVSFKGFAVIVTMIAPYALQETDREKGQKDWRGRLVGRDETALYLNQKGRTITLPRDRVSRVQLDDKV